MKVFKQGIGIGMTNEPGIGIGKNNTDPPSLHIIKHNVSLLKDKLL